MRPTKKCPKTLLVWNIWGVSGQRGTPCARAWVCRKVEGGPFATPQMAPLPTEHVNRAVAFSSCGVRLLRTIAGEIRVRCEECMKKYTQYSIILSTVLYSVQYYYNILSAVLYSVQYYTQYSIILSEESMGCIIHLLRHSSHSPGASE